MSNDKPRKKSKLPSGISEAEFDAQADDLLRLMREKGIPLTRKNYLDMAWPDRTKDEEQDAEFESSLPQMFRKEGPRTLLN